MKKLSEIMPEDSNRSASKIVWYGYALDYVLRKKIKKYKRNVKYAKRCILNSEEASMKLGKLIESRQPFAAGRIGLFEMAAMRMYEFGIKKKYPLVMNNIYNCAGFFPNDIDLGGRFLAIMKESLKEMDILATFHQLCENYFINHYTSQKSFVCEDAGVFQICRLEDVWTKSLKGKRVLVVSPFEDSIRHQYQKRELLFPGKEEILPEFELLTYRSLMTIGDMKDERFETWFDALEFMKKEILSMDFDIALLGCGAYGFPLAAEIKKAGKQAVHMGGILQILFGIMGKRWDGTRNGGEVNIQKDIAKYYNENWIYPLEEKPKEASKVEYGPYWS